MFPFSQRLLLAAFKRAEAYLACSSSLHSPSQGCSCTPALSCSYLSLGLWQLVGAQWSAPPFLQQQPAEAWRSCSRCLWQVAFGFVTACYSWLWLPGLCGVQQRIGPDLRVLPALQQLRGQLCVLAAAVSCCFNVLIVGNSNLAAALSSLCQLLVAAAASRGCSAQLSAAVSGCLLWLSLPLGLAAACGHSFVGAGVSGCFQLIGSQSSSSFVAVSLVAYWLLQLLQLPLSGSSRALISVLSILL
jgi:hypothetical protein